MKVSKVVISESVNKMVNTGIGDYTIIVKVKVMQNKESKSKWEVNLANIT